MLLRPSPWMAFAASAEKPHSTSEAEKSLAEVIVAFVVLVSKELICPRK
jgi:hypothetical protein